MSGNNRNRRWAGGVGMAVGAAFAAALIGLANAPVAGANLTTPGDFDLGAVFGDDLGPTTGATGGNFLVDILPTLF